MKEIRILLVGKTGSGKSSVGNTILGKDVFKVAHNTESCTKTFQKEEAIRRGMKIVVVDTPGIYDTYLPTIKQMESFIFACDATRPGFHIIAFVLKRGEKYTEELQEIQKRFYEWFGNDVDSFSCLIMTNTKNDQEKELYLANPHRDFDLLLKRTNRNLAVFENNGEINDKEKQVSDFLDLTENIVKQNNGRYFKNLVFYLIEAYKENFDEEAVCDNIKDLITRFGNDGLQKFMSDFSETKSKSEEKGAGYKLRIFMEDNTPYQQEENNANKTSKDKVTSQLNNYTTLDCANEEVSSSTLSSSINSTTEGHIAPKGCSLQQHSEDFSKKAHIGKGPIPKKLSARAGRTFSKKDTSLNEKDKHPSKGLKLNETVENIGTNSLQSGQKRAGLGTVSDNEVNDATQDYSKLSEEIRDANKLSARAGRTFGMKDTSLNEKDEHPPKGLKMNETVENIGTNSLQSGQKRAGLGTVSDNEVNDATQDYSKLSEEIRNAKSPSQNLRSSGIRRKADKPATSSSSDEANNPPLFLFGSFGDFLMRIWILIKKSVVCI